MQNWPVTACICAQTILWKCHLTDIFCQSIGLKCTFLSKIRLVIIWKTLILKEHYATMSSYKFCKTLDSIHNCICHFFLLIFCSCWGCILDWWSCYPTNTTNRWRRAGMKTLTWPDISTFSVVNSSGPDQGLKWNLKSDTKA